jgi:hypothetical protein
MSYEAGGAGSDLDSGAVSATGARRQRLTRIQAVSARRVSESKATIRDGELERPPGHHGGSGRGVSSARASAAHRATSTSAWLITDSMSGT